MKSILARQQSRYGTVTVAVRLGWYDVLQFTPEDDARRCMCVVLPLKPSKPVELAKELRAIAKRLEREHE